MINASAPSGVEAAACRFRVEKSGEPPLLRFGAIVLAAGGSSRMGRPKQLLPVAGQAMVVRAVRACLEADLWPVVVVLGANREAIKPALTRLPVIVAENAAWQDGMASSLRAGVEKLAQFSRSVPGVLVALSDQPGFTAEAIGKLSAALGAAPDRGIAAASYNGRCGAPALFRRKYFAELAALTGDQGARVLIRNRSDDGLAVDLPELGVDLDTPEDYRAYQPA